MPVEQQRLKKIKAEKVSANPMRMGLDGSIDHSVIRPFDHSIIRPFDYSTIRSFDHSTMCMYAFRLLPPSLPVVAQGDRVLSQVSVSQVIGGMRGIPGLLWETSLLDAESGIHFRGIALPECLRQLPRIDGEEEPRPEGMLWLLLTKEIPTKEQVGRRWRWLVVGQPQGNWLWAISWGLAWAR